MKQTRSHAFKNLNRRSLLKGAMGVSLGLPMLDIFQQSALAQGNTPKRLVVYIHCNGVAWDQWYPDTPGTTFDLKSSLKPLEAFKSRMIQFGGVDLTSAMQNRDFSGHTRAGAHLLTCSGIIGKQFDGGGYPDHISFDQEVANHIGQTSSLKSMYTGVQCAQAASGHMPRARFVYSAPNTPVVPEHRPQLVFDKLSGFVQAGD
ncbi:MAG: hypothetical protein RJA70_3085, partial [Pseudomonadota bacterium]